MGLFDDVGNLFKQSAASIVGKKLDVKYTTKAGSFLSKVNNTANSAKLAIGAVVLPGLAAKQDKKVNTNPGEPVEKKEKKMGLFDFFGSGSKVNTDGVTSSNTGSLDSVSNVFQGMLGGAGSTTNKNSGVTGNIQFGTGTSTTTTTGTVGTSIALMPILLIVGVVALVIWGIKKLLK